MELKKVDSAWNGGTRGDGYDADLYMDGRGTYYVCAYMVGQTATREFLVRETDDEDEARAWMRAPVTCEYDEAGDALLAAMAEADTRGARPQKEDEDDNETSENQ